jgi:hypothetical protein
LEEIQKERDDKKRRIKEGQNAELLPIYPAPRIPGMSVDKPRVGRDDLVHRFKFPS